MSTAKSFANVTKNMQIKYPKKDQGIIMEAYENIQPDEYVYKIGNIIGPQNIKFFARRNHRIYIYLANKELVDELMLHNKIIEIQNRNIEVKRLITPAQRLIISNVCPTIPHEVIQQVLTEIGIKMVSPITFLRAGIQREEYKHILSFRRQVYITDNEEFLIPNSLIINHEETDYRIFLTTDNTCFTCKLKGHSSNNCPNKSEIMHQLTNITTDTTLEENCEQNTTQLQAQDEINQTIQTSNTSKRSAPSVSSSEEYNISENNSATNEELPSTSNAEIAPDQNKLPDKPKQKLKKPRSESPESNSKINLEEILKPLEKEMKSNSQKYNITYEMLTQFMEEAQNTTTKDHLKVAEKYATDIPGLLLSLKNLHEHLTDRTAKNRFTRLTNRIKDQFDAVLEIQ